MKSKLWSSPVRIENPETGMVRTVKTVREAKAVLDRFWPDYHGSQHHHAEQVCEEALKGKSRPSEARQAFIAAAVEAHFHIH